MKLGASGSRGVMWRANVRGTQEVRKPGGGRERGDWWIRWACSHGHLHRALIGPKSLARGKAERHRLERPCPHHQPRPASYLLTDVIREYFEHVQGVKRTWKNDERCGKFWVGHLTPGDLEKIRTDRLAAPVKRRDGEREMDKRRRVSPATVNREFAFLKHICTVVIRLGTVRRTRTRWHDSRCCGNRVGECAPCLTPRKLYSWTSSEMTRGASG